MKTMTVNKKPKSKNPIVLVDLGRQYQSIKKEVNPAIQKVLNSSHFVQGPEFHAFAKEFAAYCEVATCAPVANGTDALVLALRALGIKSGDEVITTPMTFIATVEAITFVGAKPIFVDVDPKTYTMDVTQIESKITLKTKAIIPVHLYGQMADMDLILGIAKKRNLLVVEDACQAHGARYKGKRAGSIGAVGCFSFYPAKNLGCYGDGGAAVSNNPDIISRILRLANHGSVKKYEHIEEGVNSRLDELQSAVLRVKLRHLDQWNAKRRAVADLYRRKLEGVGDIIVPYQASHGEHVYHLFVIQTSYRAELSCALAGHGISTQIHYPTPLHLLESYRYLNLPRGSFPIAEGICDKVLSLPLFPELKTSEVLFICEKIKEFFKKK